MGGQRGVMCPERQDIVRVGRVSSGRRARDGVAIGWGEVSRLTPPNTRDVCRQGRVETRGGRQAMSLPTLC
jgi:hypothetical protein